MTTKKSKKTAVTPKEAKPWWIGKHIGEKDDVGHTIRDILWNDATLVVYVTDKELFFDAIPEITVRLHALSASIVKIRALRDDSEEERIKLDRQLTKAITLCADNNEALAQQILEDVLDQLINAQTGIQKLSYLSGAIGTAVLVWIAFLAWYLWGHHCSPLVPWILSLALGATGGVLSVCANHGTIQINLRESQGKYVWVGVTRIILALISGLGVLLAIRGGLLLEVVKRANADDAYTLVKSGEMFFCLLAGFSENYLPNILRQHDGPSRQTRLSRTTQPQNATEKK